jgi:hypothetical protein
MRKSEIIPVLDTATLVETGAPVIVTIPTPYWRSGYLVVTTSAEVGTASLVVTIHMLIGGVLITLGTLAAITTNTSVVSLLGAGALAAGEGVANVEPLPLGPQTTFVFTVTGTTASFEVVAYFVPTPL